MKMKKMPMGVMLPLDLIKRLRRVSEDTGIRQNHIVAVAVDQQLKRLETVLTEEGAIRTC